MKKKLSFLLFFVLVLSSANAYQWLRVGDPAGSWNDWVNGTIEEVNYDVETKGLYYKIDMHVVFSSSNKMPDVESDSLEIQYGFTLPPNSSIIDASLLVGEAWQNAWILDRRQARAIYEGIVNRRQDPMILYKNYADNYYLQIFPMERSGKREMKITFIVPGNFEGDQMYVRLPLNEYGNFTRLGKTGTIKVNVKNEIKPLLAEDQEMDPVNMSDATSPKEAIWQFKFDSGVSHAATILTESSGDGDVLFSNCNVSAQGYYQVAFNPSELLNAETQGKYLFVIDHDPTATVYWYHDGQRQYLPVEPDEVIENVRKFALDNLNADDQFNVQFASGQVLTINETYVSASEENINEAFDQLAKESITHESLAEQLINSTQTVQNEGGQLILITNNSDFRYVADSARAVLKDVLAQVDSLAPVNVLDYSYIYYYNYYWGEDISFYASSYLLSEIARITEGEYVSVHNTKSISKALVELKKQTGGEIQFFKAEVKPSGGFTMGDYSLSNSSSTNYWYAANIAEKQTYINDNVRLIGKYVGNPPFKLTMRGMYNGKLIDYERTLDHTGTQSDCEFMEKAWTSKYIADKESGWLNVNQMNEVVNLSIKNRILSNQTAFLALEPGMDSLLADCIDCGQPQNGGSDGAYGLENSKVSGDVAWSGEVASNDGDYSRGYLEGAKTSCDSVYGIAYDYGYKEGLSDGADAIDEKVAISVFSASPNPFVNSVSMVFEVANGSDQFIRSVELVDVLGRTLRVFEANGEPNRYVVVWDGTDDEGKKVSEGHYFVVLKTKDNMHTFKIVKE